jgi:acid phosphatase type 7
MRKTAFALLLLFLLVTASPPTWSQTTLVPAGSTWRFLDDGSDQGTAWRSPSFNDSAWASGTAKLGYGDGDEATVLGYGPNANAKYTTYYFRRSFNVSDPAALSALTLRVRRDDGIVVYLNGTEVHRDNMPAGTIGHTTRASTAAPDDGATWQMATISAGALVAGTNVIAAEVHQVTGQSSDLGFDLELTGFGGGSAVVTRGPYLQLGTPNSMTVRWRTNIATDSRVRFGLSADNLFATADNNASTTEHAVTLNGLNADTKYFYSVGSTGATHAGGNASHFFVTAPASGSQRATRVWVLGDAGTANSDQARVRDAYINFTGATHTDLWLQLGDNAYENGTDSEYQSAVFDVYAEMLRKSVTWPTLGNHDAAGSPAPPGNLPYFQMFSFPTAGQAGGVASGSKHYYSFDFGNIHFVCLDSMASSRAAGSAMLSWLEADLAANTKDWLVAFWHHPPYSKGSHDSDIDVESVEMRQNALPILENFGVDLVLTGHSHSYERSYLIDGHYGSSGTLTNAMKKNSGSGRPSETGAYFKPQGPSSRQGAVYAVAGASGQVSGGPLNHPIMYVAVNRLGSLVLDVNGARLDATYLSDTGTVVDSFTMSKGVPPTNQAPVVSITSPPSGASFATPANIALAANASDADGSIQRVEFYQGGTLLGTDTAAPYTYSWAGVAAGNYSLTARAFDNLGAATTSAAVAVTVNAAAGAIAEVEPNGSIASAQPVALQTIVSGTMSSNTDNDYFRVTVPAGRTLIVRLAPNGQSDYDLKLLNAGGSVLASSTRGAGFVDEVHWTNTGSSATDVFVQAYFYSSSGANTYTLGVLDAGAAPPTPPGAIAEVEPNGSIASAQPVALQATVSGTMSSNTDNDYFRVAVPAGRTLIARLAPNGQSDYDLQLRNAGGSVLGSSTRGTGFVDEVHWTNTGSSTTDVFVQAYFYSSSGANTYTLEVYDSANQAPTASLTAPTGGAIYTAPANVNLAANAADADGSIQRVEF